MTKTIALFQIGARIGLRRLRRLGPPRPESNPLLRRAQPLFFEVAIAKGQLRGA